MPDIVVFTQHRGPERVWVTESDVDYFIKLYARGGSPAARWSDYLRWGRRFYPPTDSVERLTLRREPARRR